MIREGGDNVDHINVDVLFVISASFRAVFLSPGFIYIIL